MTRQIAYESPDAAYVQHNRRRLCGCHLCRAFRVLHDWQPLVRPRTVPAEAGTTAGAPGLRAPTADAVPASPSRKRRAAWGTSRGSLW